MLRFTIIFAVFVGLVGLAHGEEPGAVESKSLVFDYGNYDPYDRANLYGFNHAPSVTRVDRDSLQSDQLQTAWLSGAYEASSQQVILGATSDDGGQTWKKAEVLNDEPRKSDFDPRFIDADDRTYLFFSTGRWMRWPFVGFRDAENAQVGGKSFAIQVLEKSSRDGKWSGAVDIGTERDWNCRSNGLRLSTGELLIPTHRLDPLPYMSSVWISSDDSTSWTRGSEVSVPGKTGVAELPDGQIVMSLRANDGHVSLARSKDRGRTWSEAERTELTGAASSSNVSCTSAGRLVLTDNSSAPERTRLSLRVSEDTGKTWSDALTIADVEQPGEGDEVYGRQVCYPSVCELDDGALRIVWADIESAPSSSQASFDRRSCAFETRRYRNNWLQRVIRPVASATTNLPDPCSVPNPPASPVACRQWSQRHV